MSVCRLCGSEAEILESHVIPAFVGTWIKETSATGFLRGYHAPNRRMQDLPTARLLCGVCEQRFSRSEKKFVELLFRPFHDGRSRFFYEKWLLDFAVSMAWRCLATSNREGLRDHPHHTDAVKSARDTWTRYLLAQSDYAGPYRFNLFFTPLGGSSDSPVPDGLNWYFMRGADMTPVYSTACAATFIKLPGMLFWTSIVPPDPGGWRGTRIAERGTLRQSRQAMGERAAGQFLMDRVDLIYKRINNLSPQQSQRIIDSVRRNPERAAQSGSFEAWLDDERIRRANAPKS